MAHSALKNRFTDSLFWSHRLTSVRTYMVENLNNTHKTVFNSFGIAACRSVVRLNLSIARLPLYTIRNLPFCLPGVRPVEFYSEQWQEDVRHLLHKRHKLMYSLCRVPDAILLSWHYGIKKMIGIKQGSECGDQCECKTKPTAKSDKQ